MDIKHITVDKNQQIKKISPNLDFCMFLAKAVCPVPPSFAMTLHIFQNCNPGISPHPP